VKWKCPICQKPTDSKIDHDFPFCSERCREFDLANWSSENYVIHAPAFDESRFENLARDAAGTDEEADR
jgi:uncharacterized protein